MGTSGCLGFTYLEMGEPGDSIPLYFVIRECCQWLPHVSPPETSTDHLPEPKPTAVSPFSGLRAVRNALVGYREGGYQQAKVEPSLGGGWASEIAGTVLPVPNYILFYTG